MILIRMVADARPFHTRTIRLKFDKKNSLSLKGIVSDEPRNMWICSLIMEGITSACNTIKVIHYILEKSIEQNDRKL
jgi:hypothetical protein